jgi:hypothetical protein
MTSAELPYDIAALKEMAVREYHRAEQEHSRAEQEK